MNYFGSHLVLIVMGRDQRSFELHLVFNMDALFIDKNLKTIVVHPPKPFILCYLPSQGVKFDENP
jgi:hypothetical protein